MEPTTRPTFRQMPRNLLRRKSLTRGNRPTIPCGFDVAMLLLEQLERRGAASESSLAVLLQWAEVNYQTVLPADYIKFLRYSNGTTGHGPDIYVILDAAEEVPATTEGYGTAEFAPGLVIIGSDGLGNLIGIDVRQEALDSRRYLLTDSLAIGWDDQEVSGASYACSLLDLLQAMTQNNAK